MRQRERAAWLLLWGGMATAACAKSEPFDAIASRGRNTPDGTGGARAGSAIDDVGNPSGRGNGDVAAGSGEAVETPTLRDPGGGETGPTTELGGLAEQLYVLRLHDDPVPVTFEMNRDEVASLFGERARDVLLIEVDPTTVLTESLERIRDACGGSWRQDNPDPRHDCSLSELGQTFAGPDGNWQTSAEYALVRLLTMTPANVDVSGTSSESLRELADALGIGGGYSQILSDALGIARTDPIVSTAALVRAFRANLVASHPNVGGEGNLAVSLEDALTNLASLAERYGPKDGHPGVIDPSLPPSGEVLGPDFRLRVVASSNLRQCDGIDADAGQRIVSVIADETGPTFEDELEFHFEDPEAFSLTGLVANPTVDLRLLAREAGQFVPSCLGARCQGNSPGMPIGSSSVWAIEPWFIEYDIAAAAREDYIARSFDGRYLLGLASVSLGRAPAPPGWISYDMPLNLGNPPEDQYVWETILEVAQVSLHRTPFASFPEGDVDVAFTLQDLPIGLTGAELASKIRPYLQEQNTSLSDLLLADYEPDSGSVDFYYCEGGDGLPYLFFVGETDMQNGRAYTYAHPGFFSTSALEGKLSSSEVPGLSDAIHEKLPIADGESVVHFEDDRGMVYRARIVRGTGSDDVEIQIAPAAR